MLIFSQGQKQKHVNQIKLNGILLVWLESRGLFSEPFFYLKKYKAAVKLWLPGLQMKNLRNFYIAVCQGNVLNVNMLRICSEETVAMKRRCQQ